MPVDGGLIRVEAGREESGYAVRIETGILERLPEAVGPHCPPGGRIAVICDSNVGPLYGERVCAALLAAGIQTTLLTFPAGESNKIREEWARLTDRMLSCGFGRDSLVVGLGGGVTGDLAGFVAATFMRGIPVVQVPTSLLAMIDASVGGKTGVDLPAGKNLVGAFHPPRTVLVDPAVISTLPGVERSQGLAEALKHGAIRDPAYFQRIVELAPLLRAAEPEALLEVVRRSVQIKADVVSQDEREGGVRQILNFGHTLGHALEAASDFQLPHGSAVALGMILEARVGEALSITAPGTADQLAAGAAAAGLPTSVEKALSGAPDVDAIARLLTTDKKVRGGEVRYVLLERIGAVARGSGWSHPVPESLVRRVLVQGG